MKRKTVIYEYNAENDVPVAIFMAHIDTVFPESVPLELTEKDGKWFCPAVGDDTANVALLMLMAAYVANEKPKTNGGIVFVMNSCEEGLGNLKGSRALNARYGKRIEQVVSFDGYLDGIVGMAVGSLRYKVTVKTAGGHSFADFGNVNAIERLSAIITELYQYKIPAGSAKTTFNVGTISGGTTVNSIAAQAEMLYEMRSDDYACLMDAKAYFEKILEEFKAEGVDVTAELLGERPCGNKENHDPASDRTFNTVRGTRWKTISGTRPGRVWPAPQTATSRLQTAFLPRQSVFASGAGEHTRGEWIETESLKAGFKVAAELISARFLPEEKGE